jgi:heterodisulfide reductase subunit C
VNPVLERIHFWNHAEHLIERVTGLKHRDDTSNRGAGPDPAWLADFRPARPAVAGGRIRSACSNCARCTKTCPSASARAA